MSSFDTIVLLGFGGPSSLQEVRPFLDRVLEGRAIPSERYEEVVGHYEYLGSASPFNNLTARQARALASQLRMRGIATPVEVAYANAVPFIDDLAARLAHGAKQRTLGIILSAFQSPASWQKYQRLPDAHYAAPYFDHPLFVQAHADRVRVAREALGKDSFDDVALVFTAHSIPQAMAQQSPYAQQYARCAQLVAQSAGAASWTVAYQSRSGSPRDPWLEPDVRNVLAGLPATGIVDAVVAPIGFLCDHVEVLYDLDVDAARVAAAAGVRLSRASALNDHPLFIAMLADLVEQCAASR